MRAETKTTAIFLRRSRTPREMNAAWIGYILLMAMLVLFARGVLVRTVVRGRSMDTTLHDGQHLIAASTKLNSLVKLQRGDIVVADCDALNTTIVKRLIALPGDTLEITDSRVYVNGQELTEPYVHDPMDTRDIPLFTLGENDCFLMGDNRNVSADSRHVGCVDLSAVKFVVYPQHQVLLSILYTSVILLSLCFLCWYDDRFFGDE